MRIARVERESRLTLVGAQGETAGAIIEFQKLIRVSSEAEMGR